MRTIHDNSNNQNIFGLKYKCQKQWAPRIHCQSNSLNCSSSVLVHQTCIRSHIVRRLRMNNENGSDRQIKMSNSYLELGRRQNSSASLSLSHWRRQSNLISARVSVYTYMPDSLASKKIICIAEHTNSVRQAFRHHGPLQREIELNDPNEIHWFHQILFAAPRICNGPCATLYNSILEYPYPEWAGAHAHTHNGTLWCAWHKRRHLKRVYRGWNGKAVKDAFS